MDGQSFGEVLQEFKKAEAPENIFPMLSDVALCNALVAWKSVPIKYKSAEECPVTSEQERWTWLWSRIDYDPQTFGVVAGVKGHESGAMLARLIGLRLIYPDGTINTFAKQYLGKIIVQKINHGRKASTAS